MNNTQKITKPDLPPKNSGLLIVPFFLEQGMFVNLGRDVDRNARVGDLMEEPIEFRPISLKARAVVTVQTNDNKTETFMVGVNRTENGEMKGVGVSKSGKAISITLEAVQVDVAIDAPKCLIVNNDKHLIGGLIEPKMDDAIETTIKQAEGQKALFNPDALDELSIDELMSHWAELNEQLKYAKHRMHHLRIGKDKITSDYSRSNYFKNAIDYIDAQMEKVKAKASGKLPPNFLQIIRFHQLARTQLPSDMFKTINEAAKGE